MTNEQIIADIAATIYGEDAVFEMLDNGEEIPLHTAKGWNERGYKIKKGQHGIETRLWKKRKKRDIEEQQEIPSEESGELPTCREFYLCKSFLFKDEQVERVKK